MYDLSPLTALSPLDGRYAHLTHLLREQCSEYGLLKQRLFVEIKWLICLSELQEMTEVPALSNQQHEYLENLIAQFDLTEAERIKVIEKEINHDIKALEYYIKEKLKANGTFAAYLEFVHFGCTSEDVNNLAYALMLKQAINYVLLPELDQTLTTLKARAHMHALNPILSHTHGQAATPTTMGKEFANFYNRLERQVKLIYDQNFWGKLNGAVGNYNALHAAYPSINWPNVSKAFIVDQLGLSFNAYTTQIEPHDYIAELSHVLMRINAILTDFSKDMWSYISRGYFVLQTQENDVGSSTMPHKVNPIDFENAEGNLGLANALLGFMSTKLQVSRLQRDLSDSTVLRNLGVAFGHCLIAYCAINKGAKKLDLDYTYTREVLANHWEILAEAIQMILRRHGVDTPYEKLKALTRGKRITQADLAGFIGGLAIDATIKKELLALTPAEYTGYAATLAKAL